MSGMGETLSDFIKGLYWLIGLGFVVIVILIGIIIYLVMR